MTALGYLAGISSVLVVLASATAVGIAGCRLLAPGWTGPIVALVTLLIADVFLVLDGEILGTIGLFSRVPIVVTSLVAGVAAIRLVPRAESEVLVAPYRRRMWFTSAVAFLCGVFVLAQGLVAVRTTMQTGNVFIDALEYHLTIAAHFATSHHTTGIVQLAPGSPVSYYPFNDELLHGIGITLFGRDTLSLFLGVADVGAMLLAAWCVGSAEGGGALTMCAVCPVLVLLGTGEASAINDWAAIWPLVAGVAVLVRCRAEGQSGSQRYPVIVGLAAGLAIGTKVSSGAAGVALVVACAFCVPRAGRLGALLKAAAAAFVAGGYWYVRDLVKVGSPLPSEHLPGLIRVPMAGFDTYGYSVAHYLTDGGVIRHFFLLPGLRSFFGPAWPGLLGLAVVGVVVALVKGPTVDRALGAVVGLAVLAYLLTPSGAFGAANAPYLFKINLRYALPAVVIALVLTARTEAARRWSRTFVVVMAGLLAVALVRHVAWAAPRGVVAAIVVVTLFGCLVAALPWWRRHLAATAVAGVVALVVVGYPFNHVYLNDRYRPSADPAVALYGALNGQSGVRIGVTGLPGLYPYLGPTYANDVSYVGKTLSHHAFVDYATCAAWRAAVAAGDFRFVVVEVSPGSPPPPALAWAQTDPAARPVVANALGAVFAVGPGFGSDSCSPAAT